MEVGAFLVVFFFKKIDGNNSVPYPIKLEPSVVCVEIKGTYIQSDETSSLRGHIILGKRFYT